jgi:outer membrane beta-barrel protein
MKFNNLALVALLSFLSFSNQSFAKAQSKSATQSSKASPSAEQDLDSLADDQALVQRAQAMDPQNRIQIVQKRAVDRNYRLELGGNYGYLSGGDSYLSSQNIGAYLDFHFTPRWSAGLRYNNFINQLTSEGASVYQQARAQQQSHGSGVQVPGVDSATNTELATIAWYPVYGKMNFFNSWVPHFDLYALAGFGKTQTQTGNNSDTFAGGIGLALWLSQHFSSHLEVRYQSYEDTPYLDVTRRENLVIGQIAFGILL